MKLPAEVQEALWATEICIGNPFRVAASDWDEASRFFDKVQGSVADLSSEFCERRLPDASRRLLLATGNWWAFTHADRYIRPIEETISSAHGREIGISPTSLRRVLSAVDRFYDQIALLEGVSEAVKRTRSDSWTACFGETLNKTLGLERVVNDQNVLILGEPGTGKEIVAKPIQLGHLGSPEGAPPPSPAVNGAAIPTELAESEFFGHKKGAFTGAIADRAGKIVEADHGSLFIDEVADLPALVQPKLLRVIETNTITPVGSNREISVDVRYVTATSKPIREMSRRDEFRVDLYDRLAGVVLKIPPLRDRPEDIEPIARGIIRRRYESAPADALAEAENLVLDWLAKECKTAAWEGNVRQLVSSINNRLIGFSRAASELPPKKENFEDLPEGVLTCGWTEQQVSDWYIERVYESVGKNLSRAEKVLGMDRGTVRRRLGKRSRA